MIAKNIRFSDNKEELIKAVLPGLPISAFFTSFTPDTYDYVNWHWHEAFQYCLVMEGSVDFLLPNRSYRVTEGNGIFINIQQIHLSKGTTKAPASYFCIDIPPSFICADEHSRIFLKYLEPVLQHPFPQAVLISRHTPASLILLESLRAIQKLLKENPDYMELDVYMEIIKIWRITIQLLNRYSTTPKPAESVDNDRLKVIVQYMQQHYSEKITLEDIGQQLALSRSECCRFFKKVTGQSMFSYLISLRLHKSMDLLRNSELSISEIADMAGFCSQSHFTSCFRKAYEVTPKKFRELSSRLPLDVLPLDVQSQ